MVVDITVYLTSRGYYNMYLFFYHLHPVDSSHIHTPYALFFHYTCFVKIFPLFNLKKAKFRYSVIALNLASNIMMFYFKYYLCYLTQMIILIQLSVLYYPHQTRCLSLYNYLHFYGRGILLS